MVIITLIAVINMGLLTFLKENKDARKIFGQGELRIIEKQLFGVPLTQSEKNRLSLDIRKKLEFIGGVSRFKDEFRIRRGAEIHRLIEDARYFIVNDALSRRIKKIVLYGSAAENRLTLQSDIDIAVQFDAIDIKEATVFRKRISGKVSDTVDVQVYNVLPEKIKAEIDTKGKVLYERPDHG